MMKIGQKVKTKEGRLGRVIAIDEAAHTVDLRGLSGEVFTEDIKKLLILTFLEWLFEKIKALLA